MLLEDVHHVKQILFEEHVADGFSVRSPLLVSGHSVKGADKEAGPKDTVLHICLLNDFTALSNVDVLDDVGVHDKGRQKSTVVNGDHWVFFSIKFWLMWLPVFLVEEFECESEPRRLDITFEYAAPPLCRDGSRCTNQKVVIPRITLNSLIS